MRFSVVPMNDRFLNFEARLLSTEPEASEVLLSTTFRSRVASLFFKLSSLALVSPKHLT
jgi:hypothetical protein